MWVAKWISEAEDNVFQWTGSDYEKFKKWMGRSRFEQFRAAELFKASDVKKKRQLEIKKGMEQLRRSRSNRR